MLGIFVVTGILLASHSARGLGFGSPCGCGAPPPAPPACKTPPPPPPCLPLPVCQAAVCPPQSVYEPCPVCPPIPIYEVPDCPPCPAPPLTICVAQQIPAPQPVPAPQAPVSCCARSPCAQPCVRQRRVLGAVIYDPADAEQEPTCNNRKLRIILENSISSDIEVSKQAIYNETLSLPGKHDIICANGNFSYIINSDSFCLLTIGNTTCYLFKQA